MELQPLQRQSVTDATASMPSAIFRRASTQIVAKHDGREHVVAVSVPDGPALVKDIDVAVLPATGVVASVTAGGQAARQRDVRCQRRQSRSALRRRNVEARRLQDRRRERFVHDSGCRVDQRAARPGDGRRTEECGARRLLSNRRRRLRAVPITCASGIIRPLRQANRSARILEKALGWRMSGDDRFRPSLWCAREYGQLLEVTMSGGLERVWFCGPAIRFSAQRRHRRALRGGPGCSRRPAQPGSGLLRRRQT